MGKIFGNTVKTITPNPEQRARLKACTTSAEYDAVWEEIKEEYLKVVLEREEAEFRQIEMESQAAKEIRDLREQDYFLWSINQGLRNMERGNDSSSKMPTTESYSYTHINQWQREYDLVSSIQAMKEMEEQNFHFIRSLPRIDPNGPTPPSAIDNLLVIIPLVLIGIGIAIGHFLF